MDAEDEFGWGGDLVVVIRLVKNKKVSTFPLEKCKNALSKVLMWGGVDLS